MHLFYYILQNKSDYKCCCLLCYKKNSLVAHLQLFFEIVNELN